MAEWGWSAVVYASTWRRWRVPGVHDVLVGATVLAVAYGLGAAGAATVEGIVAQVVLPAALTLGAYWLSGLFVGTPSAGWNCGYCAPITHSSRGCRFDRRLSTAPRWVLAALEFAYAAVYVVVMVGAIATASLGRDAVLYYWAVVLPAELVCYAALPFLRSRPPAAWSRQARSPGGHWRCGRLNDAIVGHGSIQVNTISKWPCGRSRRGRPRRTVVVAGDGRCTYSRPRP
jgi:hypothetical protein